MDGDSDGAPNGQAVLEGAISADRTLTASSPWLLKGTVTVESGATLTIEKGTTIAGSTASGDKGILVIERGAKLIATGSSDEPIVFTSAAATKAPGDWGGIILLGDAPTNHRDMNGTSIPGRLEEILPTGARPNTTYGGANVADSSGTLQFVRVEYAGASVASDLELSAIHFAGVGRNTVVHHVQVRRALDDCFEFFGGTVDAKYLACQHNEDDGFDFDRGYTGRLQFIVVQQSPSHAGDDDGIESDNDANGSASLPLTAPRIFNATLCGKNTSLTGEQYGLLVRRNSRGAYRNIVVSGFQAALDIRDGIGSGASALSIANSTVWNSKGSAGFTVTNHIAFVENVSTAGPSKIDDATDEVAWFKGQPANQWAVDPAIGGCFDANAPVFGPAASLTSGAVGPPDDGFFDATGNYMGAFKDSNDTWATTGSWAVWSSK